MKVASVVLQSNPVICNICGKQCKNERGLSIHTGHMHNGKGNGHNHHFNGAGLMNNEILAELYSLRQMIIDLSYKIDNNGHSINYEQHHDTLPKIQSSPKGDSILAQQHLKNYLGYGGDHLTLMDELRSALKERTLISV
ncbi:hypothetical protein [Candidatus Borrarchaeum sp.]|uniref:hypothetical protein n=1 Tax=Candidatus Borrarchaeum sp. TaxID=2846742 RepID=UPI00257F12A0|nr:hypothetical protein [Candidatus Borrarchaeum sp.]